MQYGYGRETRLKIGERSILAHGLPGHRFQDFYHRAMTASWPAFLGATGLLFIGINLLFAFLYLAVPGSVLNMEPEGFWGAFFFSVQTLGTVGYGTMAPGNFYSHIVSMLETFVGMLSVAVMAGAMFARFARPQARIVMAKHPVIRDVGQRRLLMLRAANARAHAIVEASARLRLMRDEVAEDGTPFRRIHDLKLIRDQHPMFLLGWTLIHEIDEASPLYGQTPESLADMHAVLLLSVSGMDEATAQTVHARQGFSHATIRFDHAYEDLIQRGEDGHDTVDFRRLHEIRKL